MALTLSYKATTNIPVEIEGVTTDAVRSMAIAEIERIEIFHGNRKIPLAEMFDVAGNAGDGRMDFEGDLSGVHWIGAGMREGEVHVHGNAGRHVGSDMTGGEVHVDGDAGDWVGGEMHGGLIHVRGRAGHLIGAAYRGSRRGMTGGTILIGGSVGNEIGHTMRRGWICVGGDAGDMVAFNMIAGSVFVFGECGIRAGAGMRRGTLGMFGRTPPPILPTFRHACRYRPQALPIMFQQLRSHGFTFDEELLSTDFEIYNGDMIDGGKGEILVRSNGSQ